MPISGRAYICMLHMQHMRSTSHTHGSFKTIVLFNKTSTFPLHTTADLVCSKRQVASGCGNLWVALLVATVIYERSSGLRNCVICVSVERDTIHTCINVNRYLHVWCYISCGMPHATRNTHAFLCICNALIRQSRLRGRARAAACAEKCDLTFMICCSNLHKLNLHAACGMPQRHISV